MQDLGLVGCGSFQHGSSALQLLGKSGAICRQHAAVLLPLRTKLAAPAGGVWVGSKAVGSSRQWLDLQQQLSAGPGGGSAGGEVACSIRLRSSYPAAVLPALAELPLLEVIGCDPVAAAATVMSAGGADQPAWPSSAAAGAAAEDAGWRQDMQQAEVKGLGLRSIGLWLLVWCVQAAAQQLLLLQELVVHLLLHGELSHSCCVLCADH